MINIIVLGVALTILYIVGGDNAAFIFLATMGVIKLMDIDDKLKLKNNGKTNN